MESISMKNKEYKLVCDKRGTFYKFIVSGDESKDHVLIVHTSGDTWNMTLKQARIQWKELTKYNFYKTKQRNNDE